MILATTKEATSMFQVGKLTREKINMMTNMETMISKEIKDGEKPSFLLHVKNVIYSFKHFN